MRVARLRLNFIIVGLLLSPHLALAQYAAAKDCAGYESPRIEKNYRTGRWFVVETESFQICCDESETTARHLARQAEMLRTELRSKWCGDSVPSRWKPKCQILLHSTRQSYTAAVGRGGERTVGSSAVAVKHGQISSRRIDLVGGQTEFLSAALPHELTHVILRDRFTSTAPPRWADEGIAILADPAAKQWRHSKDLEQALTNRTAFHAALLLTMDEYPRSDQFGAFYGQSASLTEFLVNHKSPEQFVAFIERANMEGYDAALRQCYGIAGVVELERQWRRHLNPVQLASKRGG